MSSIANHSRKIAIIGSGIAGLSTAAFLHQDGNDVTVFEGFETPSPIGAGLLLQPTGLAVLAMLGLDEEIISLGSRIDQLYGRAIHSSRTVLDVEYGDFKEGLFGVGTHRGTLFSALYQLALNSGIAIRTGIQIQSIDSDHVVSEQGDQIGPYDLIIDASGSNSTLRDQYADVAINRQYPFGALWSTVVLPDTQFKSNLLDQRYRNAYNMVGILPVGTLDHQNRAAFFWSIENCKYENWRSQELELWKKDVLEVWPETEDIVSQFNKHKDLTFATYRDVRLRKVYAGHTVFIGDAAHCTSPQLGQGANLALVDAMILSKYLRGFDNLEEGLKQYAQARKSHVRFYQIASQWLTPFFQSDSWFFSKARFFTCDLMCHIKPARFIAAQVLSGTKTGVFGTLNPGDWSKKYDCR